MSEIYLNLTIKDNTTKSMAFFGVFIVKLEKILLIVLVCPLLTKNKKMPGGMLC